MRGNKWFLIEDDVEVGTYDQHSTAIKARKVAADGEEKRGKEEEKRGKEEGNRIGDMRFAKKAPTPLSIIKQNNQPTMDS